MAHHLYMSPFQRTMGWTTRTGATGIWNHIAGGVPASFRRLSSTLGLSDHEACSRRGCGGSRLT